MNCASSTLTSRCRPTGQRWPHSLPMYRYRKFCSAATILSAHQLMAFVASRNTGSTRTISKPSITAMPNACSRNSRLTSNGALDIPNEPRDEFEGGGDPGAGDEDDPLSTERSFRSTAAACCKTPEGIEGNDERTAARGDRDWCRRRH